MDKRIIINSSPSSSIEEQILLFIYLTFFWLSSLCHCVTDKNKQKEERIISRHDIKTSSVQRNWKKLKLTPQIIYVQDSENFTGFIYLTSLKSWNLTGIIFIIEIYKLHNKIKFYYVFYHQYINKLFAFTLIKVTGTGIIFCHLL